MNTSVNTPVTASKNMSVNTSANAPANVAVTTPGNTSVNASVNTPVNKSVNAPVLRTPAPTAAHFGRQLRPEQSATDRHGCRILPKTNLQV